MTCERRYATAVGLAADGGVAEPADGAARETRYEYDGNNRLIRTLVPGQTVGQRDAQTGNYALGQQDLVTVRRYDANGNVVQETDARGNGVRRYYDRAGRKTLELDAAGYATRWRYDGNGKVVQEIRYAARPALPNPDGLSEAEIVARLAPGADDRIVEFDYDALGQVRAERRLNVAVATADGGATTTTTVTTRYEYNGLGKVVRKIDGAGGVSDWQYDALGREVRRQEAGFTDFEGQVVRPTTDTEYDGVGNVVRSVRRGKDDNRESDDQITVNRYGAGGRLTSQTDAAGATTEYEYDAAGNVTRTRRARRQADGSRVTDTTSYRYDGANRQVERRDEATGMRFETRYTVYGEVAGKRTSPSGEGVWQEFAEYDTAGRIQRSNVGGVTKVFLYDANGNATLTVESGKEDGDELRRLTIDQILAQIDPKRSPNGNVETAQLRLTLSEYDAANRHVGTYQPKMTNARDVAQVQSQSWVSAVPQDGRGGVVTAGPVGSVAGGTGSNPLAGGTTGSTAVTVGRSQAWLSGIKVDYESMPDENWPPPVSRSLNATLMHLEVPIPPSVVVLGGGGLTLTTTVTIYHRTYYNQRETFTATFHAAAGASVMSVDIPIGGAMRSIALVDEGYLGGKGPDWRKTGEHWEIPREYAPVFDVSYSLIKGLPNGTQHPVLSSSQSGQVRSFLKGGKFMEAGSSTSRGDGPTIPVNGVAWSSVGMWNGLYFQGQPQNATRLLLLTRPQGSGGGWNVTGVPRMVVGGQAMPGWFAVDWSGMGRGNFEFRYLALDDAGNVLNAQQGAMTLADGGASIAQNGAAVDKALMYGDGTVNLTGLGAAAVGARIRFRTPGGAWSAAYGLGPAQYQGSLPGWFQFQPAAYGLAGGTTYEYQLETLNGAGQGLGTLLGRFRPGEPGSVSQPVAWRDQPQIVHLGNQPLSAVRGVMLYRPADSGAPFAEAALVKASDGTFDWDSAALARGLAAPRDYEFEYRLFDAQGAMVNRAAGQLTLGGEQPVSVTSRGLALPLQVTFAPGNDKAQALRLAYRPAGGAGAWTEVRLPRSAQGTFALEASGLAAGDYDYRYQLEGADGALLTGADGVVLQQEGHMRRADGAQVRDLKWVITGVANSEATIVRRQSYTAFGEVASETDGRGNVTQFVYSTAGKLLVKQNAAVSVTLENGKTETQTPLTQYRYDASGNLVATLDANGQLNRLEWLAGSQNGQGRVARERHADGGVVTHGYDGFGNLRQRVDEIGRRSDYRYTALNQLAQIDRAARADGTRGYDAYDYDEAGQRIAHRSTADGKTELRDSTAYDSLGRVLSTVSAAGRQVRYRYDWDAMLLGAGGAIVGGWRTVTTDANGRQSVDDVSLFGLKVRHVDLGNHTFTYRYNNAGQIVRQQGSTGQSLRYEYYGNGYQKSLADEATNSYTLYEYDRDGNKTFEGYTTLSGGAREFYQYADIRYDALNRVTEIQDPKFLTRYEYDAVGNRRRVYAEYHDGTNGNRRTQDYWYRYDAMNRFVVTRGSLVDERITRGAAGGDGVDILYNAAGERRQAVNAADGTVETYAYTADGFLATTWINGRLAAERDNDRLGRAVSYRSYRWDSDGGLKSRTDSVYDNDAKLLSQISDGTTTRQTLMADGTLEKSEQRSGDSVTTSYYGYEWWDEAKQATITAQPYNPNAPGWQKGTSHLVYDVNGHLKEARDEVGQRSLRYTNNAQGLVLKREEIDKGTTYKRQEYYYLDGRQVGSVGNDGPSRVDYARALAQGPLGNRKDDYRNGAPVNSADFDQNYEPIGPNYPAQVPGMVTVRSGDTLQSLAAALWGDKAMWYLLADANGLSGGETLVAGQMLKVPNKVTNVHNTSATFRVYNPGEAIGDTSPTLPDPPPPPRSSGGGCGGIGGIFVAVVAVVAAVFTAGAAISVIAPSLVSTGGIMATGAAALTGGLGGFGLAAAAIGGAVGSIASQGVAMAMGMQEGFSWSQVGKAALGAGLTVGLGAAMQAGPVAQAFANTFGAAAPYAQAAAANAASQGVAMLSGRQTSFSWTGVAASVLGQAVGQSAWGKSLSRGWQDSLQSNGLSGELSATLARMPWNYTAAVLGDFAAGERGQQAWGHAFMQSGAQAVGDYGSGMALSDAAQGNLDSAWGEGGHARVLAHMGVGAVGSAWMEQDIAAGALGAGASALAGGWLAGRVDDATGRYLAPELGRLAGSAAAQLAGRDALMGGAAGWNTTENNYLRHDQVTRLLERLRRASPDEQVRLLAEARELDKRQRFTDLAGNEELQRSVADGVAELRQLRVSSTLGFRAVSELAVLADGQSSQLARARRMPVMRDLQVVERERQKIEARNATFDAMAGGPFGTAGYLIGEIWGQGDRGAELGGIADGAMTGLAFRQGGVAGAARVRTAFESVGERSLSVDARNPYGVRYNVSSTESIKIARPSWRQSELDVGLDLLDQGYRPQVSFKNGLEVPYGTKGSVRPEYYRDGMSVEVKNYDVETEAGRLRLVRNVVNQAAQRLSNLPENTVQNLTIDVRGQSISRGELNRMLESIERKSGGSISRENINILR
ncbi:LysM peptidoglycan-binding domain-containing protein [Paludibacterium paludis]|uniref:LysM peptidoglycan-binding domain-containing protein n=1 Tax=Paludibacterium paludis TaxID=1225769 RepID=UPI001E5085E1|nr:LysM peptidoglycan-binding domain-containing protein [Paludibacterium paludis]